MKAIAKALKNVNQTPKTPGRQKPTNLLSTEQYQTPPRPPQTGDAIQNLSQNLGPTPISTPAETPQAERSTSVFSPYSEVGGERVPDARTEISPLNIKKNVPPQTSTQNSSTAWDSGAVTNYGSIVPSPPLRNPPFGPPSLELPDPALPPDEESFARHNRAWRHSRLNPHITPPTHHISHTTAHPYEVGQTLTPPIASSSLLSRHRSLFKPRRTISTPEGAAASDRPRLIRRIFSTAAAGSPVFGDVPLAGYKEFDTRQAEFTKFLDLQLDKIESFYRMKEKQATQRLLILRQQLHEMRDRRMEEVLAAQRAKERQTREQLQAGGRVGKSTENHHGNGVGKQGYARSHWLNSLENAFGLGHHFGKNTNALAHIGSPSGHNMQENESQSQIDRRDFTRRPLQDDVPYRSAKRKLRLALQEFYRGLELLKSYALLNRTAFRKINKKHDKVVKARPTGRYMSEKVNKSWFVQSEVLEGVIVAVEDLYARYFERGNHKVAVGKLRSKSSRAADFTGSVFRNGLLLAGGGILGIQGLVTGARHLNSSDPEVISTTSYLLQVRHPELKAFKRSPAANSMVGVCWLFPRSFPLLAVLPGLPDLDASQNQLLIHI